MIHAYHGEFSLLHYSFYYVINRFVKYYSSAVRDALLKTGYRNHV